MLSQELVAFRRRWAARVGADPLAAQVIAQLWQGRAAHVSPVLERTRTDNPIIDPVIRSEPEYMARHVADHFRALLTLASARTLPRSRFALDFVIAHGVRRAQGGVPLRAVLQAYRTGHKTFWAIMCRSIDELADSPAQGMHATMLLSEYCIEYTDLISVVVTDAYVSEEARLANLQTRLTMAVMEDLLRGQAPQHDEGRALCDTRGLMDGRSMAVLIGRAADAGASLDASDQTALATALTRVLDSANCQALVELRQSQVVALLSADDDAGGRAVDLLRHTRDVELRECLRRARLGVGLEVRLVADLPSACDEAQLALQLAAADEPVAHLADVDVNTYLRHRADATAHRMLPQLSPTLLDPLLAGTLEAFAFANLNVKACARSLGVHTNTVYHRLNRIQELSGRDPRSFHALSELLTALQLRACLS